MWLAIGFSLKLCSIVILLLVPLSASPVLNMNRLLCNEQMATDCINSTLNRNDRDVLMIQDGRLDQNIQDLHCSTVFELKRSRMECVDESINGCGNQIKNQVLTYYHQMVDEYEGRCAREVKESHSQSDTITANHLLSTLVMTICMCLS